MFFNRQTFTKNDELYEQLIQDIQKPQCVILQRLASHLE